MRRRMLWAKIQRVILDISHEAALAAPRTSASYTLNFVAG
jgi:hypothetical protein